LLNLKDANKPAYKFDTKVMLIVTIYFLDSSALVKRYVPEVGTTWIQTLAPDANNQLYIARITWVEVLSALARRHFP
jgi:hypothetical protein